MSRKLIQDPNLLHLSGSHLKRTRLERLHIDPPLFFGTIALITTGLVILYSAANQNWSLLMHQLLWILLSLIVMLVFAQIPPRKYYQWSPWIFGICILLLIAVLLTGHASKGAQRWLNLGFFQFQPSEVVKLAMPMMLAWYLSQKSLPPRLSTISISGILLLLPLGLVAKQPDLGTALIIVFTGICVLLLAGISRRYVTIACMLLGCAAPFLWHFLHDYQRQRVLTFLNPELDPLGGGYHIIQSKIAVGSGGFFGKGFLNGTQSQLEFLPERGTDFIFAVFAEEFGFLGIIILLLLYSLIIFRFILITLRAKSYFAKILSGSITSIFILLIVTNILMAIGILPVVGVTLPLLSLGGSSLLSIFFAFGIMFSISRSRRS